MSVDRQEVALVLKKAGLYSLGVSVYDTVQRMRFNMSDDTRTVSIGPAEAEFWMTSRNEFGWLRSLPEEQMIEDVLHEARPDDVFYDIGANAGMYSCLAADQLEKPVVAFEPEPNNAARLEQNVALNDADVSVHRYALSDESGTAELAITLDQTGPAGHSLVTGSEGDSDTITVETAVGDELVDELDLPTPDIVKIDVEGAEWQVLSGLESTLRDSDCRVIYCELHRDRLEGQGITAEDVCERLTEWGYDVSVPFERDGEPFLRAKRHAVIRES